MVTPVAGTIVTLNFPFSDLSTSKRRPALVVADSSKGDWICMQITSKQWTDRSAIEVKKSDYQSGSLQRISYIRPGKLFTANQVLFQKSMGQLSVEKLKEIRQAVIRLINGQ